MQEYECKRGLPKKIDLKDLVDIHFGSAREEDGWIKAGFGTMPTIMAKYEVKENRLIVDTENDKELAAKILKGDAEATKLFRETHQRWNAFLFDATGYDAKARSKKAQEKAKKAA